MRKIKQIIRSISVLILLLFLFQSCGKSGGEQTDSMFYHTSFRSIPGVTANEITAIEALQKEYDSFVYGMSLTTETFTDSLGTSGEIKGYTALFCAWLSELFDIKFKPSLYSWGDLFAGLSSGEIDFTGDLMATEERRQVFFMTDPIAERSLKYFQIAGQPNIYEIAQSRPPRLVFLNASAVLDPVRDAVDYNFETIFVEDFIAAYHLMKNGGADAFMVMGIVEASFDEFGDVAAGTFLPQVFNSASMSTQNPKLEPVISVVSKALKDYNTRHFLSRLYSSGYHEYLKNKLITQFTDEERGYLLSRSVVPIGVDPENYPGSFYDKREKEWKGIFFDLFDEITLLTGLRFERVNDEYAPWPAVYQMLLDGEALIIPALIRTKDQEDLFLWPGPSKMTDYYALISKSDYSNIKIEDIVYYKIGLMHNTSYTEIFRKWFPNQPGTVEYQSMEDAFDALQRGEIDMVMASQIRLLYLTQYMELSGYKANLVFDQPIDLNFGINRDEAVLCSIIDKTQKMINTKSIMDQWMRRTYDYRIKMADAQRQWFIVSSVLFLSAFALVVVFFIRSRRDGRQLELRTAMLSTIYNSIPDMLFSKNINGIYTSCNPSFEEMVGLPQSRIIGKTYAEITRNREIVEKLNQTDTNVVINNSIEKVEVLVTYPDDSQRLIESIRTPLIQGGKTIGLLGIGRDITAHKKAQEAVLAASRAKGTFLAHMSHEIRTPMNSIIGFSELALDGEASEKTREYLAKIQINADWLLQIINDILDISKVESGKTELEKIPFDMHELFENCRTLIMPKAAEKGINLYFYAEPSIEKRPLGDPTRLRQVLVNLLSNAVKFTNTGTVKGLTEIKKQDDKTVTFHFEVKDSGIGMTEEQIKKIFDPFVQAETGTTREYGGTGLGLAITKNFVELMGGRLEVESAPGIGSKFSFDLTFDTIDRDNYETSGQKAVLNEIEKPVFNGEILLCEDNAMNQQVICEHLARVGLKTTVAENGRIGVETVKNRMEKGEKQFDLVFMDIHMPVMDGLEASAKIIELDTGIPIVAMTANIMSNDWEIYRTSGMNDCIGKPFTSQELWHCLLKYFTPVTRENRDNAPQKNTRIENDIEFQKKLKLMFLRANQEKYEEIEKALKEGDIILANRLAHSLKSNAGQIGKRYLQQAAAKVEQMLKDGKNLATAEQMKELETELKKVLEEFQPLLEDASAQEPPARAEEKEVSALEPGKITELFNKLELLLKTGNLEIFDYIDNLRAAAGSERLIKQIEDFDFKAAAVTLAELKKELGV